MKSCELRSIIRQLDWLCALADSVGAGARRESLVGRIADLNVKHHLLAAELEAAGEQL